MQCRLFVSLPNKILKWCKASVVVCLTKYIANTHGECKQTPLLFVSTFETATLHLQHLTLAFHDRNS